MSSTTAFSIGLLLFLFFCSSSMLHSLFFTLLLPHFVFTSLFSLRI